MITIPTLIMSTLLTVLPPAKPEQIQKPAVTVEKVVERKKKAKKSTGSKKELVDMGTFKVTAYCPCEKCSEGFDHQTATQTRCVEGRTAAVDPSVISYGTKLLIDGHEYIAEDCGADIKGDRIDIFMENHGDTVDFGVQEMEVKIIR